MHVLSRRGSRAFARPVIFAVLLLLCLSVPAHASDGSEAAVKAAVETFLGQFTEEAMLYEDRDQRLGTVCDPNSILPADAETLTFQLSGKDTTLAQMRENIAFFEKKADYLAGMRQMQNIYRQGLKLAYTYQEMEFKGGVCSVKVTEAAEFQYTDQTRTSVNETVYWIDLVDIDGQWLVAKATDGSSFDKAYSKQGGAFDVNEALYQLSLSLQREGCRVTYPDKPVPWGAVPYDGANAAAYAYTYSRLTAEAQKPEYYNKKFVNYAGRGGDCMNFASQCMWAGFGGSETTSAISGHALPMDASGGGKWYGRSTEKDKINSSWISCQSFRSYLSDTNASTETGMYATILDIAEGSPLAGADPSELVGAAAHIEGGSGPYGHAIVITAAEGLERSQIYFCGHTKNVTHVKLGDVCQSVLKVYIPRYFRTGASQDNRLQPIRVQPVTVGESGILGACAAAAQAQMRLTVTAPGGEAVQIASAENADVCEAEYIFTQTGLYRVDCYAKTTPDAPERSVTFYVRCRDAAELPAEEPWEEELPEESGFEIEEQDIPGWLWPEEESA